jgi:hypothetical protein
MELTPGRQRLIFVVIVLVLVGLGFYLIHGRGSGGTPTAAPSTTVPTTGPASASATPSGASVPPTVLPSATPASTAGGAEIYQWLPFTPAQLTAAVNTTTAFAKAYTTWSYTQSTAAYGATFNGLATPTEITSLEAGYGTDGAVQQRTADKQTSTGSGTINQITAFGSGTITFLVSISQQVTPAQTATQTGPQQYDVTVVAAGGGWQVNDIEFANQGNQ